MHSSDHPDTRARRLIELDKAHVWHPFTPMRAWLECDDLTDCVIVEADGFDLIDVAGRRWIDGFGSLWCNLHGHRVPQIDQAIRNQLGRVAHSTLLGFAGEPSIELAAKLAAIMPPCMKGLTKVFFSDCGAAAVEVAIKLAYQYFHNTGQPQRRRFIAFREGYHGDTIGAVSLGGVETFHRLFRPLLFEATFVDSPGQAWHGRPARESQGRPAPADVGRTLANADLHNRDDEGDTAPGRDGRDTHGRDARATHGQDARATNGQATNGEATLAQIEQAFVASPGLYAGVFIEPLIQAAGGMITHPPGFLAALRRLTRRHGVLLIADEVATGFCRTGKLFACEHENVQPDILCLGKGLSGGYLPMAATMATGEIFDAFLGQEHERRTFYHGHTFCGNALGCAASLASIDLIFSSGLLDALPAKVAMMARHLERLREHPHVGDIRQCGMMAGIELVADRATNAPFDPKLRVGAAVCRQARRHGLIIRPLDDTVVLMPAPGMDMATLGRMMEAVGRSVNECFRADRNA